MARRSRRRRYSRRLAGGIGFIATSLAGGIISTAGTDIYHTLRIIFLSGSEASISLQQIVFVAIGVVGIGLTISAILEEPKQQSAKRKASN